MNPLLVRRPPRAVRRKSQEFRHSRAVLAVAALIGLAGCVTKPLTWPDLTDRPRPQPSTTIRYGDDPLQRVDLWLPTGAGPHRVVLMVHGGCWQTSIADRGLMNWIADDLRQAGVAVWNIEYRGVDRAGGGYPGTFADVARAADSLVRDSGRYDLDVSRVVAVGHSAGGHLALWLAGRTRLPADSPLRVAPPLHPDSTVHDPVPLPGVPLPIAAVVSLGGLPDLEATAASPDNGCGTEVVAKLVGDRPDPYAETSVPRLLPLGARQHLVNGREDRIIPFRLATGYVAKARAAGDDVTLHTVPDTGHVELIAPETAAWRKTKELIMASLDPPRDGEVARSDGGGSPRAHRVGRTPSVSLRLPPPRPGED